MVFRARVLTVSDGVVAGDRADASGPAVVARLEAAGATVDRHDVCPDGVESVAAALRSLADGFAGLIVTTGGTGFGPRDLTPEGTRAVIEREAPGFVEAVRRASDGPDRPFGMLSRAVAGSVGAALVINAPGSPGGAVEAIDVCLPGVAHALELLAGGRPH